MASAMAIGSEVSIECIERIRIELSAKVLEMVFHVPLIFRFCAQGLDGSVMRQC